MMQDVGLEALASPTSRLFYSSLRRRLSVSGRGGRAGIAGRRRRGVSRGGRTEPLRQHRFERIGPDLVALDGQVQLIGVGHAVMELAAGIGQLAVDVDIADPAAVREPCV